jgi:hypothetical protein
MLRVSEVMYALHLLSPQKKNIVHIDWKNHINFCIVLSMFKQLLRPDPNFFASHIRLHCRICKVQGISWEFIYANLLARWMDAAVHVPDPGKTFGEIITKF